MVRKTLLRTPKNYQGTGITSHKISDVLPTVLQRISEVYKDRPDLVLAAWPSIIGSHLAPMTQALSFVDGVFIVKVKNSSLHSLLNQHEKGRILNALRQKFPDVEIRTIVFRIG